MWFSILGIGVSWVHMRLNQVPGYWTYAPFVFPSSLSFHEGANRMRKRHSPSLVQGCVRHTAGHSRHPPTLTQKSIKGKSEANHDNDASLSLEH